jgi:transposase
MPDPVLYEAAGAYHAALEREFAGVLPLVKVNPLQARRFAQDRGTRVKTDAVDARILAKRITYRIFRAFQNGRLLSD